MLTPMTSGELIRDARSRHGLTQARLALRAGTTQSAISRLERDEISPAVDTVELLLAAMGERLELSGRPLERRYDALHMRTARERSASERLAGAISWSRLAGRLASAGREARGGA